MPPGLTLDQLRAAPEPGKGGMTLDALRAAPEPNGRSFFVDQHADATDAPPFAGTPGPAFKPDPTFAPVAGPDPGNEPDLGPKMDEAAAPVVGRLQALAQPVIDTFSREADNAANAEEERRARMSRNVDLSAGDQRPAMMPPPPKSWWERVKANVPAGVSTAINANPEALAFNVAAPETAQKAIGAVDETLIRPAATQIGKLAQGLAEAPGNLLRAPFEDNVTPDEAMLADKTPLEERGIAPFVTGAADLAGQAAMFHGAGKAAGALARGAAGAVRGLSLDELRAAPEPAADPGMRYQLTEGERAASAAHPVKNAIDQPDQGGAATQIPGEPFKTTEGEQAASGAKAPAAAPAPLFLPSPTSASSAPSDRPIPAAELADLGDAAWEGVPPETAPEAPGSTIAPTAPTPSPDAVPAETPSTAAEATPSSASTPDEVTSMGSGGGPAIEKAIAEAQKPGGTMTAVFGKAKNWFRTLGPNGPDFADKMGDALSRADSIRGREAIDYNMARDRLSAKQRAAAGDLKTGLKAWMHGDAAPPEWAKPLVAGAKKAWDRYVDVLNKSGSRIVEIRKSDEMPAKIPESWTVSERKAGTFETDDAGDFKGKPGEWTVVRPIEKGARPFPTSPSTEALKALDEEGASYGPALREGRALAREEALQDGEEIAPNVVEERAKEYAASKMGPVTRKLQAANPDVDVAARFAWDPNDEASVQRQRSRAESFFAGNERAHVLEWPNELQSQNGLETFDRYLDRSAQNAAEHEVFGYRYDGGGVKNEGDFRRGINRIAATEGGPVGAEAEKIATRLLGRNMADAATPQALRTWNQFSGAASGVSKLAGSVNNYFMHAMHGAFGAARMGPVAYGKGLIKALADYGESKKANIERGVLHPQDDVLRQMGVAHESLAPYADKPTLLKKAANATSTAARVLTSPNNKIVEIARMAAGNAADEHVANIQAALGREGAGNRMAGRDATWAQREMDRLDLSPADKAKIRRGEVDQALRDKVAQNVSSGTNLSAALQDKPRMMTSPKAQSLITFKGVHVAAMREFADNALREAVNGNVLPLAQMTAAAVVLYQLSQATKTAMVGPPKDDSAPKLEDVKTPSGAARFALHALGAEGASGFLAPAAESVIPDEKGKIGLAQEIARTAAPPWASDVGNLAAAPGRDWWTTFKLTFPQAAKIVEGAGYRTSEPFVRSRLEKATKQEGTEAKKGQGDRVKWLLDREKSLAPFGDGK